MCKWVDEYRKNDSAEIKVFAIWKGDVLKTASTYVKGKEGAMNWGNECEEDSQGAINTKQSHYLVDEIWKK